MSPLPQIPIIDARHISPAQVAIFEQDRVRHLLATARRRYTSVGVLSADRLSQKWLERNKNPYLVEIQETAKTIGRPGAYMLNLSYEWGCTSGTKPTLEDTQVMIRVLDWEMPGLGHNLCLIRRQGLVGEWIDAGWPGFSGCITGMAPGRFAIAINQPPLPPSGFAAGTLPGLLMDWSVARPSVWKSHHLPASHLVRRIFDEAKNYEEAVDILSNTSIATPAFFTVSGIKSGQGCIIESGRKHVFIQHAQPSVAISNHWSHADETGIPRGVKSGERREAMEAFLDSEDNPLDLDWLMFPIINSYTRLWAVMDAGKGSISLQGWETQGMATQILNQRFEITDRNLK
jgi:hypothetical protein